MANEKKPRRRKKLRQEWNPHWSLKLLYMIFSVAGSVLKIAVGGSEALVASEGKGPVNAIDIALRKALGGFYPVLGEMRLTDYTVRVIDSDAATAAKVRVSVESSDSRSVWRTVGVSTDIIEASWIALCDSIDYMLAAADGLV